MSAESAITLAAVQARTVEEGDCLIWTGHAKLGRYPQWRIGGKAQPARRVVYAALRGPIKPGHWVGTSCGCDLCVNPEHLIARLPAAVRKGKPLSLKNKLGIARQRRRVAKLSEGDVRAIRASSETHAAQAARYGVSECYIGHIKTGRKWVDHSSPWAGLMGRAGA